MDIFVALGLGIGLQNYRHAQPVALGKGNIHNLAHIALSLILLPHTDKPYKDIRLLLLVHAILQGSAAPLDGHSEVHEPLQAGIAQHPLCNGPQRPDAQFPLRQLVGDIALAPLAGGVQKAAPQHPAHIGADIVCRGFFPGKGSGHSRFLSVVVIAESVTDIMDGFFVQCCNFHCISLS